MYVAVGPLFVECIISAELYGNVMSRIHYFSRRSSASNHLYFYGNPYFPSMSKKKKKEKGKKNLCGPQTSSGIFLTFHTLLLEALKEAKYQFRFVN